MAAWFGNMPPRWAVSATATALKGVESFTAEVEKEVLEAIEGNLCTTC